MVCAGLGGNTSCIDTKFLEKTYMDLRVLTKYKT